MTETSYWIEQLKEGVLALCALLSVNEIQDNKELIKEIDELEKLLGRQGASYVQN